MIYNYQAMVVSKMSKDFGVSVLDCRGVLRLRQIPSSKACCRCGVAGAATKGCGKFQLESVASGSLQP